MSGNQWLTQNGSNLAAHNLMLDAHECTNCYLEPWTMYGEVGEQGGLIT